MRFWIFRGLAVVFFVAALLQWISYNFLESELESYGMISSVAGWFWTVVIAAPGCFLWGLAGSNLK